MSKHTPEPWAVTQTHGMYTGTASNEFAIVGADGTIAITPKRSLKANKANARLIAASPMLLKACKMFTKAVSQAQFDECVRIANAAIAEAEAT